MNKIRISESLSSALEKQESSLKLTTAVSAVGYLFVVGFQLITQVPTNVDDLELEMPETPDVEIPSES